MHKIIDSCIGCGICQKKCPVDAISGKGKDKRIINEKRCIDCGVCGRVCPKEAVLNVKGEVVKKLNKKQWLRPDIDKSICSACSICVDICKFGCLKIEDPKFMGDIHVFAELINENNCVYCKMCEDYCPMDAIKMKGRSK